MNIFRKNLKLIIFLVVVVFVFAMIKIFLTKKQKIPGILPIPTSYPTQIISPTTQALPPVATPDPKVREFYEKLDEDTYKGFPLFDYTPYQTNSWKITYVKSLNLVVTLKENTPEARQEVLDWIKSKGVDPKSHTIIWKTLN